MLLHGCGETEREQEPPELLVLCDGETELRWDLWPLLRDGETGGTFLPPRRGVPLSPCGHVATVPAVLSISLSVSELEVLMLRWDLDVGRRG